MSTTRIVITLASAIVIFLTFPAIAATKGRILANGTASLHKNGKIVRTFTGQGPVDENALIACEGTCMVKMKGISLFAADKTMFAVRELNREINLYIVRGKINFAVSDISKQFTFYTPDGYFIKTEGFLAPASTNNAVKGFINVNSKATEIGMDAGTMLVQTNNGSEQIKAGQSIQLAMAEIPEEKDEEGNDPGGGAVLSWSSLSTGTQVGVIAVGVGLTAGIGAITFANPTSSSSQGQGGPPPITPPPTTPPPASRNQ